MSNHPFKHRCHTTNECDAARHLLGDMEDLLRAAEARAEAYRLAARRLAWAFYAKNQRDRAMHSVHCIGVYMEWFRKRTDIEDPPPCTCGLGTKRGPRP